MARDVVDIAIIELDGQELDTVRSMTVAKNDPKAAVKVMRRKRRSIGVTRGVPEYTVDLEVVYLKVPEVDWDSFQKSGRAFLLTYEKAIDGLRRQLRDCFVNDISEPYDADGEVRVTVSIVALDERAEQ